MIVHIPTVFVNIVSQFEPALYRYMFSVFIQWCYLIQNWTIVSFTTELFLKRRIGSCVEEYDR